MRIAVLDDYLRVSQAVADWSSLAARAEIVIFDKPFGSVADAAAALQSFDILCTNCFTSPRKLLE